MLGLATTATWLVLSCATPPVLPTQGDVPVEDGSLEGLLVKARRERDALLARLAPRVEELVRELQAETRPGRLSLAKLRAQLDRLGPEAAPVLLPWIFPGTEPTDGARFRAEEITGVLVRLRPAGIVEDLVRAASAGEETGRIHAIRILGTVPETERVGPVLARLFESSSGAVRLACAESLAALGGAQNEAVLESALTDSDPKLVATVLGSLARTENKAAAPTVRALTANTDAAAQVSTELVAYWLASPELVDREILDALVALTLDKDVGALSRVAILDALPEFEASRSRDFRAALDPVAQASDALVREAALACKALLGDRSARRTLLETYEENVRTAGDWWKSYEQRGNVLLRIEDYSAAAKDFKDALERLGKRAYEDQHDEIWIDLARCYALMGKLNRAASTLEDRGLTRAMKERIRADPDFAELAAHSRYGEILE